MRHHRAMIDSGNTRDPLLVVLEALKSASFLPVAIEPAKAELTMPSGHPQVEHAYAAHPLAPARYVPLATFHRAMFVEKVNEVVRTYRQGMVPLRAFIELSKRRRAVVMPVVTGLTFCRVGGNLGSAG